MRFKEIRVSSYVLAAAMLDSWAFRPVCLSPCAVSAGVLLALDPRTRKLEACAKAPTYSLPTPVPAFCPASCVASWGNKIIITKSSGQRCEQVHPRDSREQAVKGGVVL